MSEPQSGVVEQLRKLLGDRGVRPQPDNLLPDIMLKPESTEQVAAILRIYSAAGQDLLHIGGNHRPPLPRWNPHNILNPNKIFSADKIAAN